MLSASVATNGSPHTASNVVRFVHLIADLLLKHGRRGAVPTKNVSVRLPVTDLERARKLAEKRGVGYQTLIKTLLHEALKREAKIA